MCNALLLFQKYFLKSPCVCVHVCAHVCTCVYACVRAPVCVECICIFLSGHRSFGSEEAISGVSAYLLVGWGQGSLLLPVDAGVAHM